MNIDRRSFIAQIGAAVATTNVLASGACTGRDTVSAVGVGQASRGSVDAGKLRDRLNSDGEFALAARYWTAALRVDVGSSGYNLKLVNGRVAEVADAAAGGTAADVRVAGPEVAWRDPRGVISLLIPAVSGLPQGITVEGDQTMHVAPYQPAILRLVGVVRESLGGAPEQAAKDIDRQFDSAVGRYIYIRVDGVQYRVYYEEAGQGIPIVLQHTAGADGRQWRHLLEDTEIQKRFRMIAYDLPFHGKSVPPSGVKWWEHEYRLTTNSVMNTIVAISNALKLDRPVYMGCSIGGYLAPDLALYHPNDFRAVIGVNASIAGAQAPSINSGAKAAMAKPLGERPTVDTNYHPRVNGAFIGARMYEITSPVAPESYRRETGWVYSQGGPGVFAGDLYYYTYDHDLTGKLSGIDTAKVGVHFLSGEFDPSAVAGPSSMMALAEQIPGSTQAIIKGGSHFAMSDDFSRFREALIPVLDRIGARKTS